jgi:hypothetical protein
MDPSILNFGSGAIVLLLSRFYTGEVYLQKPHAFLSRIAPVGNDPDLSGGCRIGEADQHVKCIFEAKSPVSFLPRQFAELGVRALLRSSMGEVGDRKWLHSAFLEVADLSCTVPKEQADAAGG